MDKKLRNEYGITLYEEIFCAFIRFVRGCKSIPRFIYKISRKRYGRKDCLARYWWAKYSGVSIGKYSYGYEHFTGGTIVSIGKYCSIAVEQIIAAGDHKLNFVSTNPIVTLKEFGFVEHNIGEEPSGVVIGNDVWIGAGCVIFEGVTIGDGACIGARSIIRKDVPPYAVVVGVDRIVKYRFDKGTILKLLKIRWWDWDEKKISENISLYRNTKDFVETFNEE